MQSSFTNKLLKHKLALPFIAGAGIVLTVLIIKLQPAMKHDPQTNPAKLVTVIEAKAHVVRPSIIGFGTVEPDVSLSTKAEVSGRVTFVNPNLEKGAMIAAGELLVRIDDKDYQLALSQAKADLLANQASLAQMDITIENSELDLKLAKQKLKVAQSEYQRKQKLRKQGSVSQSELDAQQQNVLQLQQETQNLEGRLSTLPADKEVIQAKIAISEAKVEKAQRDIERTQVSLPFNGRISNVMVDQGQFVSTGSALFEASGFDKMLINAQFSVEDFRRLLATVDRDNFNIQQLLANRSAADMLSHSGLTAHISNGQSETLNRTAKVERIADNIDPQSRTVGVIVSVSDNYDDIDPMKKPPLVKGMYLQVQLSGVAKPYTLIPRSALHQNELFTVSADSRLKRITVQPEFLVDDMALLAPQEAFNGALIATSDFFPAVEGMSLTTEPDALANKLVARFAQEHAALAVETESNP